MLTPDQLADIIRRAGMTELERRLLREHVEEQAAEIERLKALVYSSIEDDLTWKEQAGKLLEDNQVAGWEIERLKADGERLDWLESHWHELSQSLTNDDRCAYTWCPVLTSDPDVYEDLRAAIDAARGGTDDAD